MACSALTLRAKISDLFLSSTSSGLPSDRKNLSPFTKGFREGGQLNEHLTIFFSALLNSGKISEQMQLIKDFYSMLSLFPNSKSRHTRTRILLIKMFD